MSRRSRRIKRKKKNEKVGTVKGKNDVVGKEIKTYVVIEKT